MKLLDQRQIKQKIKRLAIEIMEHNFDEKELILAGINNNGVGFANLLYQELKSMSDLTIHLTRIKLSPANPLSTPISIEMSPKQLNGKTVIIVDDVANTGRTIFYATKPILEVLPKKVEVAVLVDRKHKSFPIQPNYVGISLATTIKDNIDVILKDASAMYAVLM